MRMVWRLFFVVAAGLMIVGCAPESTHITLRSARQRDTVIQDFSRSYIYREEQGDYHILLVSDSSDEAPAAEQSEQVEGPLKPIPQLLTQRIMHIHVFWRPLRGLKGDNPSATNASIDLYVIGDTGNPGQYDVVKYEGTGFVDLTLTPDRAMGRIENGTIEPRSIIGQMSDALGKCKVEGPIFLQRNAEKARELLERIRVVSNPNAPSDGASQSVLR